MQEQGNEGAQTPGPLKVALLGTGIFAANCTFPTIRKLPDKFQLVAVWSRRKESVEAFLAKHIEDDTVLGLSGDEGLDRILHDQTLPLDALAMALPIDAQPRFIELGLAAGKHILSEKPIAATVEEAKRLLRIYESKPNRLQWSVAENFRYEPGIERVATAMESGEIGTPTLFSLLIRLPFKQGNKYLNTEWRSKPKWYGGLMPDVFVHSTALLRKVFAKRNLEATQVTAVTTSTTDHIPSIDTMSATITFANNSERDETNDSHLHGTVSLSFACPYVKYELEVVGDKGSILLQRKTKVGDSGYIVIVLDENGQELSKEEFSYGGIEREFVAFADACQTRRAVASVDRVEDFGDWNTPMEAMKDIELVEACLKSGLANGKPIRLPL